MKPSMRRGTLAVIVPAVVVCGLAAAGGGPQWASAGTADRSPDPAYPHHLTATPKDFQQIDTKPKGDSPGDEIVDTFTLTRGGHRVGHVAQVCVLTDAEKGVAQCSGTLALRDGRISIGGEVNGSEVTTMAVLGGTGRYRSASGDAAFTPAGDSIEVDLDLRGVR